MFSFGLSVGHDRAPCSCNRPKRRRRAILQQAAQSAARSRPSRTMQYRTTHQVRLAQKWTRAYALRLERLAERVVDMLGSGRVAALGGAGRAAWGRAGRLAIEVHWVGGATGSFWRVALFAWLSIQGLLSERHVTHAVAENLLHEADLRCSSRAAASTGRQPGMELLCCS